MIDLDFTIAYLIVDLSLLSLLLSLLLLISWMGKIDG